MGVDIDPEHVQEARDNARKVGVADRVRFVQGSVFDVDLHPATAVTLYLLPPVKLKLKPKRLAELRPGTPVVSHAWDMGDWEPDAERTISNRKVYLQHVPRETTETTGTSP